MTRLEGSSRFALAAAAVDQHPAKLDAERIADVAAAIERMVPSQQDRLIGIAQYGRQGLFAEVTTVQHLVNDIRRDRVKKSGGQFFEAFLNPDDVIRGLRWFQAKRGIEKLPADERKRFEAAVEARDVGATAEILDRFGFDADAEPIHWIARMFSSFPKDGVTEIGDSSSTLGVVSIRGKPAEQIPQLEATLATTLEALPHAKNAAERDELRARAADTFSA